MNQLIKSLELKGFDTDWYYKAKKQPSSTLTEKFSDQACNAISAYFVECSGKIHSVMTVTSDGKPYMVYAKLNCKGKACNLFFCGCCKKLFKNYTEYGHKDYANHVSKALQT